ncbi:MAG TPA: filamentous hemagglutinin N-terminal domain-containing protein, partial [Nitrospira sp.]|nr:filamentous hemagglutinin N-terminal domain-containing protein [Nitrospira sp.]
MDKGASVVRTVRLLRVMIGLVPLLWVPVSLGQTTSITSSGLNTHVSHTTGQQNYDITGGTRPDNGTNLFHSFGDFSVGVQDVARFVNDAHLPTTNILSRVTGGNPSNIFGEINTTNFPGANLYLINPAGVLFGATATLNVSGSVHVSTADYLRLADGLRFNAIPGPQDTLLSQAPVVAFGFLHAHPRPITVQGSRLSVGEGKVLSLVGGDIKVTGGTLTASSGQINLVSLAGKGEARVAPDGIAIAGMTPRGQIVIKERFPRENHAPVAGLDTSGDEGGAVVIRGGRLSLTGAEVIADARVANHTGRGIVIEATDSATMDNVSLRTSAFGVPNPNTGGGAGPISVTAPSMTASNSSISTSSGNNGPAGDVAINVGSLTASNLQIETGIGSGNRPAPASGNISIRATGDVTLQNSGISTGTFGLRDAGHITVRAATLALTEGSSISSGSQFDGSSGGGRAGNIAIDVEHLTMRTSSSINT